MAPNAVHNDVTQLLTADDAFAVQHALPLPQYDALLLYADDNIPDIAFAMDVLEELSVRRKLKVCRMDHMLAGNPFVHEATQTLLMRRCNRLVIVLSDSFVGGPLMRNIEHYARQLTPGQRERKIVACARQRLIRLPDVFRGMHVRQHHLAVCKATYWRRLYYSVTTYQPSGRYSLEEEPVEGSISASPIRADTFTVERSRCEPPNVLGLTSIIRSAEKPPATQKRRVNFEYSGTSEEEEMSADNTYDSCGSHTDAASLSDDDSIGSYEPQYTDIASIANTVDFVPAIKNVSTPNDPDTLSAASDSDEAEAHDDFLLNNAPMNTTMHAEMCLNGEDTMVNIIQRSVSNASVVDDEDEEEAKTEPTASASVLYPPRRQPKKPRKGLAKWLHVVCVRMGLKKKKVSC